MPPLGPLSKMTWALLSQPSYPSRLAQSRALSPCNSKKNVKNKKQKQNSAKETKRSKATSENGGKKKRKERPIADPITLLLKLPHAKEIHCRPVPVSTVGVAYPNRKRPHQRCHCRHARPVLGSDSWSNDED